jgi:hypothetical protein
MPGDTGSFVVMGALVLALAIIGVVHLTMDFRLFKQVVEQCEQQGYIQNDTTRIVCHKEK